MLQKKKLNIKNNSSVIGYAGSINNVYLIQDMIKFFKFTKKK